MIMYNTNKKEDGQVVTFTCGKIAYTNPKRKANLAEVIFGFRMLSGNKEPYFVVGGYIWNTKHTDCVTCGCGVHKEIQKYANNNLLSEMIELGEKYHLVSKSKIPNDVVKRIEEILTIEHMP